MIWRRRRRDHVSRCPFCGGVSRMSETLTVIRHACLICRKKWESPFKSIVGHVAALPADGTPTR